MKNIEKYIPKILEIREIFFLENLRIIVLQMDGSVVAMNIMLEIYAGSYSPAQFQIRDAGCLTEKTSFKLIWLVKFNIYIWRQKIRVVRAVKIGQDKLHCHATFKSECSLPWP